LALERLRGRGWISRCIYDVGASNGAWTHSVSEVFPLAAYHLFEPLAEINPLYAEGLDWGSRRRDLSVSVHAVALDDTEGEANLGVSVDPTGSSLLVDQPIEGFPTVVPVRTRTLDAYRREWDLPAPDLLKIDTQGLELRVLRGAQETLARVEVVLVEAWLQRGYGPDTPLLHELLGWLAERGFYLVEFAGEYRDASGTLMTQDVLLGRPGIFRGG
jgi:FkbM family methyltransferase